MSKVTQADREKAAEAAMAFARCGKDEPRIAATYRGEEDNSMIVQAFASHREQAEKAAYAKAYDRVRGTNADMCKDASRAYQLCCGAVNELRVGYNPAKAKGESQ